jgi:hypothetical protein
MGHRTAPRAASDGPRGLSGWFQRTRISGCLAPVGILPKYATLLTFRQACGALCPSTGARVLSR